MVQKTIIVHKAKERYKKAKAEVDQLKEQVAKREVELQHLLDARMAQL